MHMCEYWVFPQSGSVLFLTKVTPVTMVATSALHLPLFLPILVSLSLFSFFLRLILPSLFCFSFHCPCHHRHITEEGRTPAITSVTQLLFIQGPRSSPTHKMEIMEIQHAATFFSSFFFFFFPPSIQEWVLTASFDFSVAVVLWLRW